MPETVTATNPATRWVIARRRRQSSAHAVTMVGNFKHPTSSKTKTGSRLYITRLRWANWYLNCTACNLCACCSDGRKLRAPNEFKNKDWLEAVHHTPMLGELVIDLYS